MNRLKHSLFQLRRSFLQQDQRLMPACGDHRRDDAPPHGQLVDPGLGNGLTAGRGDDARVRCAAGIAGHAIAERGNIVVSTGGTGFTPRDVTPEAVMPLLRRVMDGFSVVFHQASMGTIGVSTLQSRAFAGQADDTFIFCVPGSTGACRDAWDLVLGLEFDSRYRPCSIAGQLPRLRDVCA